MTIDTSSFHASADPQSSSLLFAILPPEIRDLVYAEFWKFSSSRLHIAKRQVRREIPPDQDAEDTWEEWLHVPCIIDPRVEEARWGEAKGRQSRSEWCMHWACREQFSPRKTIPLPGGDGKAAESRPIPGQTGFLNLLTTCKRM